MSRKRARENQEITALVNTSLKDIHERFAEIETITDVAEKIQKLHELKQVIAKADSAVASKEWTIIDHRMYANPVAFFFAWPLRTRQKLHKQNPGLSGFDYNVKVLANRASAMLDKTIKSCSCDMNDLEKIARSPYFAKALKNCEQLQDIFNAAMVKKAALSDAPQETTPASEPEEPRVSRIRRDSIPRI